MGKNCPLKRKKAAQRNRKTKRKKRKEKGKEAKTELRKERSLTNTKTSVDTVYVQCCFNK